VLAPGHHSLDWPGGDWALPVLLAAWLLLSRALVVALRRPAGPAVAVATAQRVTEEV
jgi:hypothetical protein